MNHKEKIVNNIEEHKKDNLLDYMLYALGVCVFVVIGFSFFVWLRF